VDGSKEEILGIARSALSPQEVERSLIYWNARKLRKGEEVLSGPSALTMPFEGTVVFVDLAPRFNWAHPCLYLFINEGAHQARVVRSSFPPSMDRDGDRWVVLLQFGNNPEDEHDSNVLR
jgi:hypothetical protein